MPKQRCPNCQEEHDVSIFVSGQRVRCSRCGIRFEVTRDDVSAPPEPSRSATGSSAAAKIDPELATDATRIRKGLSIPGYEVVRTLGRGGMGEVYLARQLSLGREVAVKVLADHLATDSDFVRRFEKEAAALATLSHPNIVSIIDRGTVDGTWYFVMEYVEGRSLRELLAHGGMAPETAVRIIVQVCRAIDYAHARGVIHRDLKPENILVDATGQVKVADFGLAGMVGGDDRLHLTRTDMAMGTFHYMAPEQRKSARDVDGRADLYSLGVMLYELLTGEVPVGRFRLPSERLEGVDGRLDEIVLKALESDRELRYQRASAVGDDLDALLAESALGSKPPASPVPATSPERPAAKAGMDPTAPVEGRTGAATTRRRSSVVVAARGRLRKAGVIFVGTVGALALGLWLFLGHSGRQAVRDLVLNRLDQQIDKARGKTPDGSGKTPGASDGAAAGVGAAGGASANGQGVVKVPLELETDGADRSVRKMDFVHDVAGTASWYTYRGQWELQDGALVFDVFEDGRGIADADRTPRAFLGEDRFYADGYRIDATVRLSGKPNDALPQATVAPLEKKLAELASQNPATAKLYLYAYKRRFFTLSMFIGDSAGYSVSWNLGDGQRYGMFSGGSGLTVPVADKDVRLSLWIEAGAVHAAVDGKEIGSADVGKLGDTISGRAGVGCMNAVCTFETVRIAGRLMKAGGQGKAPSMGSLEPIEP